MNNDFQTEDSIKYLFSLSELFETISFRSQFIKNKRLRREASQQLSRVLSSLENLREKIEQSPISKSITQPNREQYKKISQQLALFFGLTCSPGEDCKPTLFRSFTRNILTDIAFYSSTTRYRGRGEEIRRACTEVKREISLLHNYFPSIFSDLPEYGRVIACSKLAPKENNYDEKENRSGTVEFRN